MSSNKQTQNSGSGAPPPPASCIPYSPFGVYSLPILYIEKEYQFYHKMRDPGLMTWRKRTRDYASCGEAPGKSVSSWRDPPVRATLVRERVTISKVAPSFFQNLTPLRTTPPPKTTEHRDQCGVKPSRSRTPKLSWV